MGLRVAAIETDIEQLWVEGESSEEAAFSPRFIMSCLSPRKNRTWLCACVCGCFGTWYCPGLGMSLVNTFLLDRSVNDSGGG